MNVPANAQNAKQVIMNPASMECAQSVRLGRIAASSSCPCYTIVDIIFPALVSVIFPIMSGRIS
jgi:hypothetical protein